MPGIFSTLFRFRDKKSPDKLGRFPLETDIGAFPERRYLWTARLLVIFGAFSICLTMMLAMTLYLLLPQRGARPQLINANRFFSYLENVEPGEKAVSAEDLLSEERIFKYVKMRHEVPASQAKLNDIWARGSEFYWLSSSRVYQQFAAKATADTVTNFIKQGLTRKVEIEWSRKISPDLWEIQFHTISSIPEASEPSVAVWRAYIRFRYEKVDEFEREGVVENPFGFKIRNYSLSYLGKPDEARHYLETAKLISQQKYNDD